jgi:uncharacterized RDD family membrane protein YckC
MSTVMTPTSQRRNIEVYFLAAPEDQPACEEIIKHLKPIIRSSPFPIQVNSDFNIPPGTEKEKHKQRLLEADIVLALISVDFINNDEVYGRNQKVIERYNKDETALISILVRNFMWKSTPFVSLPLVPKNLQPLNNKQFWNSPDDAVTAVVSDIYDSINELARSQQEAIQAVPVAAVEPAPAPRAPAEAPRMPMEVPATGNEFAPGEAVPPMPAAELQPTAAMEMPAAQPEPEESMKELPPAVQPLPVEEPSPERKPALVMPIPPAGTSEPSALPKIAADWRAKYYRTVMIKRAGAILLDHIVLYVVLVIILIPFAGGTDAAFSAAFNWVFLILYFVIMPLMESSKWQGTIGKRILKLQITDREGDRVTFLRAFWRNIMRSVVLYSYFISFGILLVIQYLRFNKTRKLFHDELSGTVIGERLTGPAAAPIAVNTA